VASLDLLVDRLLRLGGMGMEGITGIHTGMDIRQIRDYSEMQHLTRSELKGMELCSDLSPGDKGAE